MYLHYSSLSYLKPAESFIFVIKTFMIPVFISAHLGTFYFGLLYSALSIWYALAYFIY